MCEKSGERIDPLTMVDISEKEVTHRTSEAVGKIWLKPETIEAIRGRRIKKGNPLEAAAIAGVLAAKKTAQLIPLCHPLPLASVNVTFYIERDHIEAGCVVAADYRTGVEMEALTGVAVALLTIWDMVKYLEKDEEGQYPSTRITDVRVVRKTKGETDVNP